MDQQFIESSVDNDVHILKIVKRRLVDSASIDGMFREIEDYLSQTDAKRIVVDLAAVEYLSSAGLGTIIKMQRRMAADKRKLTLHCPVPSLLELFQMTKLDTVLDIHKTLEDAIKAARKKRFGLF